MRKTAFVLILLLQENILYILQLVFLLPGQSGEGLTGRRQVCPVSNWLVSWVNQVGWKRRVVIQMPVHAIQTQYP